MRTSNIHRSALHNRGDTLVRCATETTAIRNADSAVWQSAATGTDQDDLAAAWTRSLPGTGGRAIESLSHRRLWAKAECRRCLHWTGAQRTSQSAKVSSTVQPAKIVGPVNLVN